jgi:hypothetical protein
MTTPESINLLVKDCHQNAINKDFWAASQNVGEKLMLVNTELAEFFEMYRKDNLAADEHCPDFTNQTIEIADAIIRLFDLAGWLHMHNLGEAIEAKMKYNLTRPQLHGKKF